MSGLLLRQIQQSSRLRSGIICRYMSGTAEGVDPPMLLRLRSELKTAMKARDKPRLDVIKGVLANITNAEKLNKPMNSDEKIGTHMLRQAEAQRNVAKEFESRNRKDLSDKEVAQASILEGYAAEIPVVSEDSLKTAILAAIEDITSEGRTENVGGIIQVLRRPDGPLEGQIFAYDQAIRIMKDLGVAGQTSRKPSS